MSFSQPFPFFQSSIGSPAAAAAAAAARRVARAPPGTKTARHGRTNRPQNCTEKLPNVPSEFLEKKSFSQLFPLFQSPISSPAAAAAAAAAVAAVNRRVARAPPGTKTARHGRTNRPQNRTEKLPNVPSEFLEKMSFSQPFPLFQLPISSPAAAAVAAANRRVARAPPSTKTARHGRANRPQNRTEKVSNVPSEFLEKMSFSQPFPLFQSAISSPAAAAAAAANRRVARAPPGTKTARHGRTNRP